MTDPHVVTAATARAMARDWVETTGLTLPGFGGAWLAGSVSWMPDHAELPTWSDVDVMCVLEGGPSQKLGKLRSNGVLLEISHIDPDAVATADALLANYRVVAGFDQGQILADPTGRLTSIQHAVQAEFPKRQRIIQRLDEAQRVMAQGIAPPIPDRSLAEQVMWVFPAGIITHLPLVAALQNPTVRRRYETSRALLKRHDRLDLHERILDATGYGHLSRNDVEHHFRTMVEVFDATSGGPPTHFPWASDITPAARPIAVDGTWDLISRGLHRESMFWVIATWARALTCLRHQQTGIDLAPFEAGFERLMETFGVAGAEDLERRSEGLLALLPEVRAFAESIIDHEAHMAR